MNTKGFPYFPLYAAEFVVETMGMSAEERSAYVLLLCQSWLSNDKGTLPADDETLARLAGVTVSSWKKMKVRVLVSFTATNKKIMKLELVEQWKKLQKSSESQSKNAHTGWQKRRKKNGPESGTPRPTATAAVAGDEHVIDG